MCAPKLKNMCKLLPKSAPQWMVEAMGMAVWCRASQGGIFDDFVWILPIYSEGAPNPFMGHDGNWYKTAEPVMDEQALIETEGMR